MAGTKRGALRTSWKRRFFVLRDNASLSYYKTDDAAIKAKGIIPLMGSGVEIRGPNELCEGVSWPREAEERTRMEIAVPGRTFFVFFDTSEDCEQWVARIKEVLAPRARSCAIEIASLRVEWVQSEIDSKQTQHRIQSELKSLSLQGENSSCADCQRLNPTWASWNLGIFICLSCAGCHRSLGVHISKVKSLTLDTWTSEQVQRMKEVGNAQGRQVFEALLPATFARPVDLAEGLDQFIRQKYAERKWCVPGTVVSPTEAVAEAKAEADDNAVLATLQAEASGVHAAADPMADHAWF